MTARRLALVALLGAAMLAVAAPAYAYSSEATAGMIADLPMARGLVDIEGTWTLPDPIPCEYCHGLNQTEAENAANRMGPHGGYITTTNKCATCHSTHAAVDGGVVLLPSATIKGTCETCHDGTGGRGVYGTVEARGETVASAHRIDWTNVIPGGDPSGSDITAGLAGVSGTLTCSDCHSPHGTAVVAAFVGDRARALTGQTISSTKLLKQRPHATSATVTVYGSDWCGACHVGRLSGSGADGNHPVDSTVATDAPGWETFTYSNVARVNGADTTSTVLGIMGLNNFGYVIPDEPRGALQTNHAPICQQCHEDGRSIGNEAPQEICSSPSELFSVTATYSTTLVGDNPEFQVFPHESQVGFLLVESNDTDTLCLNCHL